MLTFSRTAVSGSIIDRTSCTNWLTLDPTSPAPTRMTMLFGVPEDREERGPFLAPFGTPVCVRRLARLLAIATLGFGKSYRLLLMCLKLEILSWDEINNDK